MPDNKFFTRCRRNLAVRILARVLFWYLVFGVILFVAQRKFIFHPVSLSTSEFVQTAHSLPGFHEVIEPFSAVVLEPSSPAEGTVVLFHGNAGTALDRAFYAQEVLPRNFRLVLAEFPGYGSREGEISERSFVEDAKNLYAELRVRYPSEPMIVMGESLGTGVATRVAAESRPVPERLVLLTPFSSLGDVAGHKLPMYPTHAMVRDAFDSSKHIHGYHGPVSILLAGDDEVVGVPAGKALVGAAALRGVTQEVFVPNAGHSTWFYKTSESDWDTLLGRNIRRSGTTPQ